MRISTDRMIDFSFIVLAAFCLFLFLTNPPSPVSAQNGKAFHVSGQAIPASATAPVPIEGTILSTDVNADMLIIANTDSSAHTVTVVDCTAGTAFSLFNGASIAATTTWIVPLGNMRFKGCFKWSASSTTVMGSLVGNR